MKTCSTCEKPIPEELGFCPDCDIMQEDQESGQESSALTERITEVLVTVFDSFQSGQERLLLLLPESVRNRVAPNLWVTNNQVIRDAQSMGLKVESLEDIRWTDIDRLDKLAGRYTKANGIWAVFTGAGLSLPGGFAILATLPADIALLSIFALRCVDSVARCYGFDISTEDEKAETWAVLAMAFGVESISVGGQKVAMTALAKYIRYTPYSRSIIMRIIKEMAKRFGIQITKQGFGKIVPVVGALIGGGFNWFFMISVGKRAKSYYRNRLLEWRQNRDPDADLKPIQEPQQFLIDV